MEIIFLSKIIRELVLYNDRVSLPRLGSFVAEVMPSVFSDGGLMIHPPTRRISFRVSESWNDGILEKRYAEEQSIPLSESEEKFRVFAEEVSAQLNSKKSYILPEFGVLRATDQNDYFFVPDKEMLTYIESFGLEPLNIKILQKPGVIEQLGQGPCTGMSEREKEGTAAIDTGEILEIEYDGVHESDVVPEAEITAGAVPEKSDSEKESVDANVTDAENKSVDSDKEIADSDMKSTDGAIDSSVSDSVSEDIKEDKLTVTEKKKEVTVDTTPVVVKPTKGPEKKSGSKVLWTILIIAGVLIVALIVLIVFKEEFRPFWEWLLYSEAEREILNM